MTVKDLVSTLSIDYNISLEEDGVFLCKTTSKNKLLEVFNNREVIEWCPRSFSSTFDVDKVVEQLEKSHFHTESTFDDDGCCNDDSEEVVNLNEAIEIVRKGGIDG